jgi:hypothetical protein
VILSLDLNWDSEIGALKNLKYSESTRSEELWSRRLAYLEATVYKCFVEI